MKDKPEINKYPFAQIIPRHSFTEVYGQKGSKYICKKRHQSELNKYLDLNKIIEENQTQRMRIVCRDYK